MQGFTEIQKAYKVHGNLIESHNSAFQQQGQEPFISFSPISLSYPAGAELATPHAFLVDD